MPRLALHSEFRYTHELLPMDDPAIPVLGHEDLNLVAGLRRRLTYSHGGTTGTSTSWAATCST